MCGAQGLHDSRIGRAIAAPGQIAQRLPGGSEGRHQDQGALERGKSLSRPIEQHQDMAQLERRIGIVGGEGCGLSIGGLGLGPAAGLLQRVAVLDPDGGPGRVDVQRAAIVAGGGGPVAAVAGGIGACLGLNGGRGLEPGPKG